LNSCDTNVSRCIDIIELNARVQRELFKLLNLVSAEGKHYYSRFFQLLFCVFASEQKKDKQKNFLLTKKKILIILVIILDKTIQRYMIIYIIYNRKKPSMCMYVGSIRRRQRRRIIN